MRSLLIPVCSFLTAVFASSEIVVQPRAIEVSLVDLADRPHADGLVGPRPHSYVTDMAMENVQNALFIAAVAVIPDTGSSNLWVSSTAFNASLSLTLTEHRSRQFAVEYGSGKVHGHFVTDTVSLGNFAVVNIWLGVVDPAHIKINFQAMDVSGILGLGFHPLSAQSMPTFMDSAHNQRPQDLPRRSFSFYLTRAPGETGSRMLIGSNIDHARFIAPGATLHYVAVTQPAYWTISLVSIGILGDANASYKHPVPQVPPQSTVDLCRELSQQRPSISCTAFIDSGTSFIGIPASVLPKLIAAVTRAYSCSQLQSADGHTYEVCDCTQQGLDMFPPLRISTRAVRASRSDSGSTMYADDSDAELLHIDVQPIDYVQVQVSTFYSVCIPSLLGLDDDTYSEHANVIILGTPFLRSHYVSFDADAPGGARVGIALSGAPRPAALARRLHPRSLIAVALCGLLIAALFSSLDHLLSSFDTTVRRALQLVRPRAILLEILSGIRQLSSKAPATPLERARTTSKQPKWSSYCGLRAPTVTTAGVSLVQLLVPYGLRMSNQLLEGDDTHQRSVPTTSVNVDEGTTCFGISRLVLSCAFAFRVLLQHFYTLCGDARVQLRCLTFDVCSGGSDTEQVKLRFQERCSSSTSNDDISHTESDYMELCCSEPASSPQVHGDQC